MPTESTPSVEDSHPASALPASALGRGRIAERRGGLVVFKPRGTNYELHLENDGFAGETDKPVSAVIHVDARKVYTVPSGGNFVAPIMGTPRIVQGRVLDIVPESSGRPASLIIKAGAVVVARLPEESHAVDLGNGSIEIGSLVNVVALPGATLELA
jgi:hypothetical protein